LPYSPAKLQFHIINFSRDTMSALHFKAQQALAPFIETLPLSCPVTADRWIAKSILQKSIRRGDADTARRAAATLLQQDRSALWRRLVVIAFEDIGIGCIEAVIAAVAVTDAKFRRQTGDDQVLASLVALMCEAPKDRSSDYLAVAVQHPRLASAARHLAMFSPAELMEQAFDPGLNLFTRSLALRALWHDPETNSAARDLVIGNFGFPHC
jgi:MgsA AAA+ ATPase C terminal